MRRSISIPSEFKVSAVVFYPFDFRWEEPAWRTFELSQRLLDTAVAEVGTQALLFGPSEFIVHRPEDDNAWAASTAVLQLVPYGVAPERAVVVRAWAERHQQSGRREVVNARGEAHGSTSLQETLYRGHVEVLHPSSRALLLEVDGEALSDPFAERLDDGADGAPELTQLMERLTREALAALGPHLRPLRPPSPPLGRVIHVPWEAFRYSEKDRPAFAPQIQRLDALDGELLRQQRLRFANPTLPLELLPRLTPLPAGLYVLEAPASGPLAAGELVVSLDTAPALPHVLARARLAPRPLLARIRLPDGTLQERLLP